MLEIACNLRKSRRGLSFVFCCLRDFNKIEGGAFGPIDQGLGASLARKKSKQTLCTETHTYEFSAICFSLSRLGVRVFNGFSHSARLGVETSWSTAKHRDVVISA